MFKKVFSTLLAVSVLVMSFPSVAFAAGENGYTPNDQYSYIVSAKTGKAVQITGSSADPVTANADIQDKNGNNLAAKALFKMLKSNTNSNLVSFSSVGNQWNMLKSETVNGLNAITNSNPKKTTVDGWESFTLEQLSDGSFTMKDGNFHKFVSVNDEGKLVTTDSEAVTDAEKFFIVEPTCPPEEDQVATDIYIEHVATHNIVTVDGVAGNPIDVKTPMPSDRANVPENAIFKLGYGSFQNNATVNFKSNKNTLWTGSNNFVRQVGDMQIGGWESVQVVPQGDGTVAFKQTEGWKYITVSDGKMAPGTLTSAPTDNEKFIIHTTSTPKKVSKITMSKIEGNSVTLSWSALEGTIFSGYEIWRSEAQGGPYTKVGNETAQTTYTDTGLQFNTKYYYVVRTVNGQSPYAQSSEFSVTTLAGSRPSTPPSGLDIAKDGNNIKLTWNADPSVSKFEIYRAGGKFGNFEKIDETTEASYIDTNPNASKYENYYKITSVNEYGTSDYSNITSLETKMFGNNMIFYNAKYDNMNAIGQEVNAIHDNTTFQGQFIPNRYGLYFKPGNYNDAGLLNIGFYTQIAGLGKTPLDTKIQNLSTPACLPNNNATQTFWRTAENFTVSAEVNPDDKMPWAVSQAAPLRRMNVERTTQFDWNYGWASGGFVADSAFSKNVGSYTQQQWYSRNSDLTGGWYGVNWNGVFQGDTNAPKSNWDKNPGNPYTTIDKTPIVREKPFLYLGDDGEYKVFVPDLKKDSSGISWSKDNMGSGQSLDISKFYIAKEGVDTAETLNAALDSGKNLFFTPGIYELTEPLHVKNANTIILGTGLATLVPKNEKAAMLVDDQSGVIVAGLLFDAYYSSTNMLQVGQKGSDKDHSNNPISLSDLYFRIGGFKDVNVNVDTTVEINSNDVIGDHFWVWRADHGAGVAWDRNTARNGLVVNGNNATMYGMFVEHFNEYQTIWNGENGRLYFYQSETPYDPQSQEGWMSHDGTVKGYASYKVSNRVNNHLAVGLGVYDVFINTNGASIFMDNAIEVPNKENVTIQDACIVELGASDGPLVGVNSIVNGTGNATSTGKGGKGYAKENLLEYKNGIATLLDTKGETPVKYTKQGTEPTNSVEDWRFYIPTLVGKANALNKKDYTPESWSVLVKALNDIKALLNDNTATATTLGNAYNSLDKAIKDLQAKAPVDKSVLEKLYNDNKDKSQGKYTDSSWKEFQGALTNAKTVLDNEDAVQADVDAALKTLQDAITNLAEVPVVTVDRSALVKLYNDNNDKSQGKYTDSSWKAFQDALTSAKTVLDNKDAKQTDVDVALKALQDAIANLKEKTEDTAASDLPKTGSPIDASILLLIGAMATVGGVTLRRKKASQE
ncbi:fibronectin type III domain-containing protein [Clostridium sp. 'White wine YQ']|uniref:fibronectin type III domain-containing protein n=1 Tax=Clostridium sp. 'White wine YQ' TaxID=3027474 RepID=UPI002366E5BA|nr:fibronectin type III domain-containing protein [Clostridium sp. 'White wine YQ']MDD7794454.1 fibronectin type III domain-containing protein [Clostridium sp. 'White wine YQ']